MPIKKKFIILFLTIAVLPVVLITLLVFFNSKKALLDLYFNRLEVIADLKGEILENFFGDLKSDAKIAQDYFNIKTNLPIVTQYAGDRNNPEYIKAKNMLAGQLGAWLKIRKEMSDFLLIDPNGKIVWTANETYGGQKLDRSLPDPENKAFPEGKKGVYISDIYKLTDQWTGYRFGVLITAPVVDFNGQFIGELAFEIDMDSVYKFIQDPTGLGKTGQTLLLKKMEDHALVLNPLRYDPGAALSREIFIGNESSLAEKKAVNGENGFGIERDYRGKEVMMAWRWLPLLDWGMMTKIDMMEVLEPVITLGYNTIFFCIIILVFVIVIATMSANAVARPIQALYKGTQIIGAGNLDYAVGTNEKDEIGQLSRSFDTMVSNLKKITASRDELDKQIAGRKQAEERFRFLFELDPSGLIMVNETGAIELINRQTEILFGYTREELIGQKVEILIPERYRVKHLDHRAAYYAKPNQRLMGEGRDLFGCKKDGKEFPIEVGLSPIKTDEGHFVLASIIDISERKRNEEVLYNAKEAAETANRVKSDFIANMSHELRTPLNAILGFSQILQAEYYGKLNEEQKVYVKDILDSGQHLLSLINEILDMSKIEAGKMELHLRKVHLQDIFNQALTMLNEKAKNHAISLKLDVGEDLPPEIEGDERKIKQIVFNLLSNALKFIPDGSEVTLAGRKTGEEEIEISVTDNGPGISVENQKKLFLPFERLNSKAPGTGLGLALCKRMVALWGGKIGVVSPPEGQERGARFYFTVSSTGRGQNESPDH